MSGKKIPVDEAISGRGRHLAAEMNKHHDAFEKALDEMMDFVNTEEARAHATSCLLQTMDEHGISRPAKVEWAPIYGDHEGWYFKSNYDMSWHVFDLFQEFVSFKRRFEALLGFPDCFDLYGDWKGSVMQRIARKEEP